MGKIFCIMGKSATGKDTIYQKLLEKKDLDLKRIIPYTTRPIRKGEVSGREYYFCTEEDVQELEAEGCIVEMRSYDTVHGVWKYLTVDDASVCLAKENYLVIGTLESYKKIRDYFENVYETVVPIYIEVEDGERLLRAIYREKEQKNPKYEEMCRRFLADSKDFSEENLKEARITKRFVNQTLEKTIDEITDYIKTKMQ